MDDESDEGEEDRLTSAYRVNRKVPEVEKMM